MRTDEAEPQHAATSNGLGTSTPVAWTGVLSVTGAMTSVLLLLAGRYGYHADELYFRLLGLRHPAWGYVDQPPLLPLLYRAGIAMFGDTLWAVRLPGAVCYAAMVVLGTMMTAELGGRRGAQLLTACGLGTSYMVLVYGHYVVTSTVDLVAWCAVELAVLRALLRRDGRWWLVAGTVCGLAMYAKYIVLLLPLSLLAGVALVGPRGTFRDRRLYGGAVLTLVLGAPNLVYQTTQGFPQLQMAHALADASGSTGSVLFVLVGMFGVSHVVFAGAGAVALWRRGAWRPARALVPGFLACVLALLLVRGGRGDYACGYLVVLFAVGCVAIADWSARGRLRTTGAAAFLTLGAALNVVVALPVLPVGVLNPALHNTFAVDSVGWQELTAQVAAVYNRLPDSDRQATAVLVDNYGEAGALDRYGSAYHLPPVYSGNNELHLLGPPPDTVRVVIAVAVDPGRLASDFAGCRTVTHIDNDDDLDTTERHAPVMLCHDPVASWTKLWPHYRSLKPYERARAGEARCVRPHYLSTLDEGPACREGSGLRVSSMATRSSGHDPEPKPRRPWAG